MSRFIAFLVTYNPRAPKRVQRIQAALILAILVLVFGVIPGLVG